MEIRTYGGGRRLRECERILAERLSSTEGRLILLPIPTARDGKYITGTGHSPPDILSEVGEDTAVVGYGLSDELIREIKSRGGRVYDGALDEDFLASNAELTARGTIGYILTHSGRDVGDMRVGIVGYGRIGSRLARWLLLFGAKPVVYTRRRERAVELGEMGISASVIGEAGDISRLDLLINTAPERHIDEGEIPREVEIIDLASGVVFEPSDRLIKLSSVPDAMFPISAGRLYAESAIRGLWGGEV